VLWVAIGANNVSPSEAVRAFNGDELRSPAMALGALRLKVTRANVARKR